MKILMTAAAMLCVSAILCAQEPQCGPDTEQPEAQEGVSIKSEAAGNRIIIPGHSLTLRHTRKLVEDDRVIYPSMTESPDKKKAVIWAGDYITYDFWYLDRENDTAEWIDIDVGKYNYTRWYNNEIAEIQWGGSGYTISEVFKFGAQRLRAGINDIFYIDPDREIYVSGEVEGKKTPAPERYLVVGSLFDRQKKKEKFPLPYCYQDGWWYDIIKVSIDGDKLSVCRNKCGDDFETLVFEPEILKEKQAGK